MFEGQLACIRLSGNQAVALCLSISATEPMGWALEQHGLRQPGDPSLVRVKKLCVLCSLTLMNGDRGSAVLPLSHLEQRPTLLELGTLRAIAPTAAKLTCTFGWGVSVPEERYIGVEPKGYELTVRPLRVIVNSSDGLLSSLCLILIPLVRRAGRVSGASVGAVDLHPNWHSVAGPGAVQGFHRGLPS